MKGDFSRLTGRRAKRKHYSGVLKQQGRVQLDSDWNELIEIVEHQRRTRTIDTIGNCGAPIHNSGFKISHPGDDLHDFLISTGRFYAGGLLCELNPVSRIPIESFSGTNKITIDSLKLNGDTLAKGQWIIIFTEESPEGKICQIKTDTSTTLQLEQDITELKSDTNPYFRRLILYSEQPDHPDAPLWSPVSGQTDLVYLDVWDRHITAIEDPEIRETALGGPETDTRKQTVAQVKVFPDVGNVGCPDELSAWQASIAPGNGRLKTQKVEVTLPEHPCELGESGGYQGLENHLYRVEIHSGGSFGTATFKWSRDNASTAYAIEGFQPGYKIKLKQSGKDEVLRIKENDWLEVSGEKTDLDTENAGTIAQVKKVDDTVLTLDRSVSAHSNDSHPKVRRWDVAEDASGVDPVLTATATGPINLEKGVQLSFSGDTFRTGDYWVFAARVATGDIEELDDELPLGVNHHHCKLALVTGNNDGTVDIEDCRPEFPPLTEISRGEGCCTVTVGKGGDFDNIQEAVNEIGEGPGTVCILPGTYEIRAPIDIKGKDITIRGCGGKSLILNSSEAADSATVFIIEDSWGITIRDLWAVTLNGDRAVVSTRGNYVQLINSLFMALGISDNAGAVVFRGPSLGSEVGDCLIAGIAGVRFEPLPESPINLHAAVRVEQNTIFALQSAILQLSEASFIGCSLIDNYLFGFATDSLLKVFFPPHFLEFAKEAGAFDQDTIDRAESINRDIGGIGTTTKTNTAPVYHFADHLKTEASIRRASVDHSTAAFAPTRAAATVIELQAGAADANIRNNTIMGETGIEAGLMMESLMKDNVVVAARYGVLLGDSEGLAIEGNIVMAGLCGICSQGRISMNLDASNNRIIGGEQGIQFLAQEGENFHLLSNIQINGNSVTTSESGIEVDDPAIFIYDFTAVDNSIVDCRNHGIALNGYGGELLSANDLPRMQRVIQRNSIRVNGAGIRTNLAEAAILGNDVTVTCDTTSTRNDESYGIIIQGRDCTVADNSVQGIVNLDVGIVSKGGVLIDVPVSELSDSCTVVSGNHIVGGNGNGVEIVSEIEGMTIDKNVIQDMNLNGIAVAEHVGQVTNMIISNNEIFRCNSVRVNYAQWWKYAGIVLGGSENIQIVGNSIHDNGRDTADSGLQVGGIYVTQASSATIADNHLIDNGPTSDPTGTPQGVIHIPGHILVQVNNDVKVLGNTVKGSYAPALCLGTTWVCYDFAFGTVCFGLDLDAVVSANRFESLLAESVASAVELQCSRCVFSNNVITSEADSVDLGYGWFMTVIGNVTSQPITGAGWNQVIEHNVSLT